MNEPYTRVTLNEWSRGSLFQSYMDHMRIVMSLTVDIDVTELIAFAKKNRLKFYPSMIWVVSKVVNAHDEFKYGWDGEGNLIKWDFISPSYTDFHKEDEGFTKYVTAYSDDLFDFCGRFALDQEKNRNKRAFVGD